MENNIPLHENDLNFKDMAEKKFITRAVQTDQENENERYNNSCFDRYSNKTLLYIYHKVYSVVLHINFNFKTWNSSVF